MPSINLSFESLENLLSTFQQGHTNLMDQSSQMNSTLLSTDWQSPRATAFTEAWQSQYYPNIQKILEAVQQFNGDIQGQLERYKANEGIG